MFSGLMTPQLGPPHHAFYKIGVGEIHCRDRSNGNRINKEQERGGQREGVLQHHMGGVRREQRKEDIGRKKHNRGKSAQRMGAPAPPRQPDEAAPPSGSPVSALQLLLFSQPPDVQPVAAADQYMCTIHLFFTPRLQIHILQGVLGQDQALIEMLFYHFFRFLRRHLDVGDLLLRAQTLPQSAHIGTGRCSPPV